MKNNEAIAIINEMIINRYPDLDVAIDEVMDCDDEIAIVISTWKKGQRKYTINYDFFKEIETATNCIFKDIEIVTANKGVPLEEINCPNIDDIVHVNIILRNLKANPEDFQKYSLVNY